MKLKIFVNVICVITIFITYNIFCTNFIPSYYADYGLTDFYPTEYIVHSNLKCLIASIIIVLFMLAYNLFFKKEKINEEKTAYKIVSIVAIIICFCYLAIILKPVLEIFIGSFIFELYYI